LRGGDTGPGHLISGIVKIFNNFFFILHIEAKGLPPLPDPSVATASGDATDSARGEARKQDAKEKKGLSFSSSSSGPGLSSKPRHTAAKRKVVGGGEDGDEGNGGTASASKSKKVKKKPKVGLSFADDA
jgi:hypothetical protein